MATSRTLPVTLGDAIDRCLAGCYRDGSPMLRLSERLDELRREGWSENEIRRVELLVLKRLVGPQADQIRAS